MKKGLFPDTMFTRLFGLVLAAIVVSHVMTFILLAGLFGDRFPLPPIDIASGHISPPRPGPWIDRDFPLPPTAAERQHHKRPAIPRTLDWSVGATIRLVGSRLVRRPDAGSAYPAPGVCGYSIGRKFE